MPAIPAGAVLVDASLLISVAQQEPLSARFVARLPGAEVTSVNFGEVLYKLAQTAGMSAAATEHAFLGALGVVVVPVDLAVVRHYPELKQLDARSRAAQAAAGVSSIKSLSLADMTCLAYAMESNLPVLTGDKHWTTLHSQGLQLGVYDYRDPALTA